MSFFTATDTIDATTFLRSVNQPDGSFSEHFLMQITGFGNGGNPAIPKEFGKAYDLYLTLDATGKGTVFDSLNLTLWADPKANDGTPGVTETSDPSFSNGTTGDIVLATGTMVSANLSQDAAGTRHADFVEKLTPTLAGTILSGGSLKVGGLLEERLTTPSSVRQSIPQPDGTTINLVIGGTAKIDAPSFDAVQFTNNVYSVVQPDHTFVAHRIDPITGFTADGSPVVPDGFGNSFGLYFDILDTGVSTPTSLSFTSSSFRLMLDPGNHDGPVTSTVNGITFANTGSTGAADDIVLGTGTMVSGVASFDPTTGIRTTHFVENYVPVSDESDVSPFVNVPAVFDFAGTTLPGLLVNTPGPNGMLIQTINGAIGSTVVAKAVPDIGASDTLLFPDIAFGLFEHKLGFIFDHGPHGHIRTS
jgi:hypothetical protein